VSLAGIRRVACGAGVAEFAGVAVCANLLCECSAKINATPAANVFSNQSFHMQLSIAVDCLFTSAGLQHDSAESGQRFRIFLDHTRRRRGQFYLGRGATAAIEYRYGKKTNKEAAR
jgi:hypothetical protein